VGAIESWFDFGLLDYIAEELKDVHFLVIGAIKFKPDNFDQIQSRENITFYGKVDNDLIASFLQFSDVGIIPFRLDMDLVHSISPLKLYEYSAADKSLTATELSPAKLDYINVPFMLHGYVVKGLSLNAGVQVGFLTKVKWSGKQVKAFLNEEHGTIVPSEPSQMSTMNEFIIKNTDAFHKVDISVPLGASYEFMNVVLDARYNLGLTKVSKGGSSKNRVFMVTLGYKFDL